MGNAESTAVIYCHKDRTRKFFASHLAVEIYSDAVPRKYEKIVTGSMKDRPAISVLIVESPSLINLAISESILCTLAIASRKNLQYGVHNKVHFIHGFGISGGN